MKPIKLTVAGINSFIEERTVDFEGLSRNGIFCVCGPTGSGKSTILDCIIMALYAPRENHRGAMKDYVNTKCEKGKITFVFESDGVRYEIVREIRRNTSSTAKFTNLDTSEVLADRADTATDCIKKMLKLDKEDFTKVVILEQGRFAEFMRMGKTDRYKMVAKLFGLERFERLKDTLAAAKKKYESELLRVSSALKEYEGFTEALLADKKKQLAQLNKDSKALHAQIADAQKILKSHEDARNTAVQRAQAEQEKEAAQKAYADAQTELQNLQSRQAAVEREKAALTALKQASDQATALLPLIKECERDEEEIAKYLAQRQEVGAKYKKEESAAATYAEQQKTLQERTANDRAYVAQLCDEIAKLGYTVQESSEAGFAAVRVFAKNEAGSLRDAEKKQSEYKQNADGEQRVVETLFVQQNALKAMLSDAQKEVAETQQAYEHARLHSAAAVVRSALHSGDTCPVCGGAYHGDTQAVGDDDARLAALKAAWDKCLQSQKETEETLKTNEVEYARHNENLIAAQRGYQEAQDALKGKSAANADSAATAAQKGEDTAKRIADSERTLRDVIAHKETAERERDRIAAEGQRIKGEIEKLREKIHSRIGERNPVEVEQEANGKIATYTSAQKAYEQKAADVQKQYADATASAAAAQARAESAQKTLEILPDKPFDTEQYDKTATQIAALCQQEQECNQQIGSARESVENLQEQLAKKKELAHEKKEIDAVLENVLALNKCTERDNKLLAYVAENYVDMFTRAASETLSQLTDGKYSLVYDDGEFYVEDFFADNKRRKVKTLSGGETFLASMSIAMAISRAIAQQNYEFFFLDEGFGTLDERAMDTVTRALTELSRETTVGLITHRDELADRIPARLTVIPATEDRGSDLQFTQM